MHKIKKAIAELRQYLGRDTRGLDLLAAVETVADEVRKQAASEKERADAAMTTKAASVESLRKADLEILRLRSEVQQEQTMRRQLDLDTQTLERRIAELSPQEDKEPDPGDVSDFLDIATLRSLTRAVRRWRRNCPDGWRCKVRFTYDNPVGDLQRDIACHDIRNLIHDLSQGELLNLGRMVAVQALMNCPIIVASGKTIRDVSGEDDPNGLVVKRLFLTWMRKQMDDRSVVMGLDLGDAERRAFAAAEGRPITTHDFKQEEARLAAEGHGGHIIPLKD